MLGFPGGSVGQESACNAGDPGSILELGRSTGEGIGYPLRCSGLENPMDRGAWRATVHRVAGSDTTEKLWFTHSGNACVCVFCTCSKIMKQNVFSFLRFILKYTQSRASQVALVVKNLPAMQETWVRSLDWEDPPEKGKATNSSILAWRILGHRVGHNWTNFTFTWITELWADEVEMRTNIWRVQTPVVEPNTWYCLGS